MIPWGLEKQEISVTVDISDDESDNIDEEVRSRKNDLVWERTMASSYHPSVVSKDRYFRFHTKIVKAEPGIEDLRLHLVGRGWGRDSIISST